MTTHERRILYLYTICEGGQCGLNGKPAIWVDGAIHGRELVSPAAVAYLMSVSNYMRITCED